LIKVGSQGLVWRIDLLAIQAYCVLAGGVATFGHPLTNMTTSSTLNRELKAWRQSFERLTSHCAWVLAVSATIFGTGCAATPSAPAQKPGVAPEVALVGKVVRVDPTARFVVLTFPLGQTPAIDRRLDIYRAGSKVGEVKVSVWQREDSIVADILTGDCQIGDAAWAK
jgi:hypothetical protein